MTKENDMLNRWKQLVSDNNHSIEKDVKLKSNDKSKTKDKKAFKFSEGKRTRIVNPDGSVAFIDIPNEDNPNEVISKLEDYERRLINLEKYIKNERILNIPQGCRIKAKEDFNSILVKINKNSTSSDIIKLILDFIDPSKNPNINWKQMEERNQLFRNVIKDIVRESLVADSRFGNTQGYCNVSPNVNLLPQSNVIMPGNNSIGLPFPSGSTANVLPYKVKEIPMQSNMFQSEGKLVIRKNYGPFVETLNRTVDSDGFEVLKSRLQRENPNAGDCAGIMSSMQSSLFFEDTKRRKTVFTFQNRVIHFTPYIEKISKTTGKPTKGLRNRDELIEFIIIGYRYLQSIGRYPFGESNLLTQSTMNTE